MWRVKNLCILCAVIGGLMLAPPSASAQTQGMRGEASSMLYLYPNLVNRDVLKTLKSTNYGPDDLVEWRKGWADARAKTPLGYFGDPASGDANRGKQAFDRDTASIAATIKAHLQSKK